MRAEGHTSGRGNTAQMNSHRSTACPRSRLRSFSIFMDHPGRHAMPLQRLSKTRSHSGKQAG